MRGDGRTGGALGDEGGLDPEADGLPGTAPPGGARRVRPVIARHRRVGLGFGCMT